MRWSNFFIIVIAMFSLFGCKKTEEEVAVQKEVKLPKMEETFPFSEAEKIEIISYPVRYEWDTIVVEKDRRTVLDVVINKKLQVSQSGIKDKVIINEKSEQELFNLLMIEPTPQDCSVASCFNPRHLILFYNDKSEVIAHLEICFECGQAYASKGFEMNEVCYEKMGKLSRIFKDAGVKYFGETGK